MAVIDIVLRDGLIWMPVDFPVKDATLTWKVWSETETKRAGNDWALERKPLDAAKWLVSFRDGTFFDVGPIGKPGTAAESSPDVRAGQEIRLARERLKGRHSYRLTVNVEGQQPYAVFDCPSIIIT